MNLPRQMFVANFKIVSDHDYHQEQLQRIGVQATPDGPLCSTRDTMNFTHLAVCATMANIILETLPIDNFISKASLYYSRLFAGSNSI
ncbi:hypothetical protein CDAR_48451 [Caerostris darwini]|uniref:Uncharacterized protein n=1 Tax=Caerostris darwini TaxID=1538125 RepID=A0AAV4NHD1_9ARAC|nr:hypothetical protein CDAR_48451 [Caerostris darwini]